MSHYKIRNFQQPEVNWLGNWDSNESLNSNQSYVKTSQIKRSQCQNVNTSKFVVEPHRAQFSNLPPRSLANSSKCSTRSSCSPAPCQRTNYDTHFHKCDNKTCLSNIEKRQSYQNHKNYSSCGSSPCKATVISANFNLKSAPNSGCYSNPSSRRNSITRSSNQNLSHKGFNSPFSSIETISICNQSPHEMSNRSLIRQKYEDYGNQRSTRSYTPTVVIESNRSSPGRGVSIIVTKRNKVLQMFQILK